MLHSKFKTGHALPLRAEGFCVREVVAMQERIGLQAVTDGEFRRRSWSAGFIDAVEGFGLRDGTLGFRNESGVMGVASSPYAKEKLRRKHRIVADDFRFLQSVVKRGVPKVTIAAPDVMHVHRCLTRGGVERLQTLKRRGTPLLRPPRSGPS